MLLRNCLLLGLLLSLDTDIHPLKHEVKAADEWHDNGPQYLVTVSLCIQMAFVKKQLCSLFVVYMAAHNKPNRHRVHNVDITGGYTSAGLQVPCPARFAASRHTWLAVLSLSSRFQVPCPVGALVSCPARLSDPVP